MTWFQKSHKKQHASLQLNSPTQKRGAEFEQKAKAFVIGHGIEILAENFRCKHGEIDFIGKENGVLIFFEVRYRRNSQYGGALESISKSKQNKLIKTMQYFLTINHLHEKMPCRFDVIVFENNNFNWLKNAFS